MLPACPEQAKLPNQAVPAAGTPLIQFRQMLRTSASRKRPDAPAVPVILSLSSPPRPVSRPFPSLLPSTQSMAKEATPDITLGDRSEGDPPVPIPNTEVKPLSPDGTACVSVWESRTSPIYLLPQISPPSGGLFVFAARYVSRSRSVVNAYPYILPVALLRRRFLFRLSYCCAS
jgi:hypothetical protein